MSRMGKIYRKNYGRMKIRDSPRFILTAKNVDTGKEYIYRAERLRIVKGHIQTSPENLQEIKQGLDTNIIKGRHEKASKRALRRLGYHV